MKRSLKLKSLALVIALLMLLGGCGSNPANNNTDNKENKNLTTSEKYEYKIEGWKLSYEDGKVIYEIDMENGDDVVVDAITKYCL